MSDPATSSHETPTDHATPRRPAPISRRAKRERRIPKRGRDPQPTQQPAVVDPARMTQRPLIAEAAPGRGYDAGSAPAAGARPETAIPPGVTLEHLARQAPDECEVAERAMPVLVAGDLDGDDIAWLDGHVATCDECAASLHGYHRLDDALGRLETMLAAGTRPPAFIPPAGVRPAPRVLAARRPAAVAAYGEIPSPLGPLLIAASPAGVCEISFGRNTTEAAFVADLRARGFDPRDTDLQAGAGGTGPTLATTFRQLDEYFAGNRAAFDLPVDYTGVSPFTAAVLDATASVPFGQLTTYAGIARTIGKPAATRAVGNALGKNPVPVIVPCHRVVRSDWSIGGYTGGVGIKERLLTIEGTLMRLSAG